MPKNLGLFAFALALPFVSACEAPGEELREEQQDVVDERMEAREQAMEEQLEHERIEQQKPEEEPMGDTADTL